ncbi:MAG: hypothetical protein JNK82_19145 [Myxococcaceae bacterium]|nr:hypothetical protein [Myxococcaceae bacterium]
MPVILSTTTQRKAADAAPAVSPASKAPKHLGLVAKPATAPRDGLIGRPRTVSAALTGAPRNDHIGGSVTLGTTTTTPKPVHKLVKRADFDKLSAAGTGAGAAGMPEVKFLLDRKTGQLHFLPKEIPYHYFYARDVLGIDLPVEDFNRIAYLDPNRRFVAGTLTAYDNYVDPNGKKGTFGMSFWSTDIVRGPLLVETQKAVQKGLAFFGQPVVYRPGGQTQETLLEKDAGRDKKALQAAGIPVLTNTELSKGFDFTSLNPGEGFGTLRIIKGQGPGDPPPTRRDVVIYADEIPADVPPLGGMATPKPQTYLSHGALKARQDDTPYAYARDILSDPKVKQLEGKLVKLEVTAKGYSLRAATKTEADTYFEKMRPKKDQKLHSDLKPKEPKALDQLTFRDAKAYGSKAANVAELLKLYKSGALNVSGPGEPKVYTPDGWGIPASWYDTYMKTAKYDADTTLEQRIDELLKLPALKNDPKQRAELLADFREHIEDAAMPPELQKKLDALQKQFKAKFPNDNLRIRSSSNSEDLQGFSGAGLFDSFTFRFADQTKPNKTLGDRFQKVFASVFNDRAFAEFDYYRVDSHTVDMAELVMPNSDDEIANGVVRWGGAIPGWDTITVNAQVGESLVTNPEGGATPDSIVMGNYGFNGEAEIQYEQQTNQKLPPGRKHVLTDGELKALFKAMKVVQTHFKKLYGKENDPTFSIECEFKIEKDGRLLIKQARPWVY